jgi:cell division protein FtsQ
LQQVGAQGFAHARLVDPRQLPVPIQSLTRQTRLGFSRAWILHRRAILRWAALCVVLVGAGAVYEEQDAVRSGADAAWALAQVQFAHWGFGISKIEISGQSLTSEKAILNALEISPSDTTLTFDADAALSRVESIPTVNSVNIRKIYPNALSVSVTERVPMARWQIDGVTKVVDEDGNPMVTDDGSFRALPLVVGQGAADDAKVMIKTLDRYPALTTDLAALSRIGARRWDLIFYSGLRVELPESGVAQALEQLAMYEQDYQLLDRDVNVIDMRVPGMLSLKLGDLGAKAWADYNKAHKQVSRGGDAEYETAAERAAGSKAQ